MYFEYLNIRFRSIPWPLKETPVQFDGFEIIVRPESGVFAPSVVFEFGSQSLNSDQALHIIRRFFSALSREYSRNFLVDCSETRWHRKTFGVNCRHHSLRSYVLARAD